MRPIFAALAMTCLLGTSLAVAQTTPPAPGTQPNQAQPNSTQRNSTQPNSAQPDTVQPGAVQPGAGPAARPNPAPEKATKAATGRLAQGANSFTAGQARSRLQKTGFKDVSDLAKDQDGVWRGKAMYEGKQVNVGVDYKGNVSMQ